MDFKEFNERIYRCKGDILTSRHEFLVFIGTDEEAYQKGCIGERFIDLHDHIAAKAYTTIRNAVIAAEWMTRGSLVIEGCDEYGRGLPLLAAVDTSRNMMTEADVIEPGSCFIVEGAKLEDIVILFDSRTDRLADFIPGNYLHVMMQQLQQESLRDYRRMLPKESH